MAHQLLESVGVEVAAGAVGRHYGSRKEGGVIDGWLVDTVDAGEVEAVEAAGIRCRAVPLMMTDHDATAAMAAAAVDLRDLDEPRSMRLEITAPDGVPEVRPGDDLAALLTAVVEVADGDIVMVTSKVVSKAEGRMRTGDRDEAVRQETVRLVARRGSTSIVRNRLGLTLAAAGVDASNVEPGWVLLLPEDPDESARRIRAALRVRTGRNVAVIVTDTAGRAWRTGQTDIAIGAAGLVVAEGFIGRHDPYGNPLRVTELAVADELAGAAELVQGKLSGRPFAVVRGRSDLVLPPDEDGPGAADADPRGGRRPVRVRRPGGRRRRGSRR